MSAKKSGIIEWVGGRASLPVSVRGHSELPEFHGWMDPARHVVLATEIAEAGASDEVTVRAFERALSAPIVGPPRRPDRARVESTALAKRLRLRYPDIEFVVGPTPELDILQVEMRKFLEASGKVEPSYFDNGVRLDVVAAFCHAAARFYRAAPWKAVPSENWLFELTIERFGIKDHVVSVMGQLQESFGTIIFESYREFQKFMEMQEAFARGGKVNAPPHIAFTLSNSAETSPRRRRDIQEFGLEIASKDAIPELIRVDENLNLQPPSEADYKWVEAMALAFVELVENGPDLERLERQGISLDYTTEVTTHIGPVSVRLRAPHAESRPSLEGSVAELMQRLEDTDKSVDPEASRQLLHDEILNRFESSEECNAIESTGEGLTLLSAGLDAFDGTLVDVNAKNLRDLLLEIAPRMIPASPDAAGDILLELRAFFAFLWREVGFPASASCIKLLGPGLKRGLKEALSSPEVLANETLLLRENIEAVFDLTSQQVDQVLDEIVNISRPGGRPKSRRPSTRKKAAKKSAKKIPGNSKRDARKKPPPKK